MIIDGVHLAVTKQWIEDVLTLRVQKQGENITMLFMVTHAPREGHEGDGLLETPLGKLRVFWRNDMPEDKLAQILHLSKYRYPVKGQALEIANMITRKPHEKREPVKAPTVDKRLTDVSDDVKNTAAQAMDELLREGFANPTAKPPAYDNNGDLIH